MTKKFGSLSQEFQPLGFAWPSPVCLRAYGEVNRHMKRSLCFIKKKSGDKEHSEELASLE